MRMAAWSGLKFGTTSDKPVFPCCAAVPTQKTATFRPSQNLFNHFITNLRRNVRYANQEIPQPCSGRTSGTPAEEALSGFDRADLLSHCSDPMVQRHAVLTRQPCGGLLDRQWQLQGICALAHVTNLSENPLDAQHS